MKRYELILNEIELVTLEELGRLTRTHPSLLESFLVNGLLDPEYERPQLLFGSNAIVRVLMIKRLRNDLGVNLAGCGLVLDLLERIDGLEREIEWFRRGV